MDNTDISSTLFLLNSLYELHVKNCRIEPYYIEEEDEELELVELSSLYYSSEHSSEHSSDNLNDEDGLEDSLFEWIDALIQYRDQCYTGELNEGEPRFPSDPSSSGEPRFSSNPSSLFIGEEYDVEEYLGSPEEDEDYLFEHKKELYCFRHSL